MGIDIFIFFCYIIMDFYNLDVEKNEKNFFKKIPNVIR